MVGHWPVHQAAKHIANQRKLVECARYTAGIESSKRGVGARSDPNPEQEALEAQNGPQDRENPLFGVFGLCRAPNGDADFL